MLFRYKEKLATVPIALIKGSDFQQNQSFSGKSPYDNNRTDCVFVCCLVCLRKLN